MSSKSFLQKNAAKNSLLFFHSFFNSLSREEFLNFLLPSQKHKKNMGTTNAPEFGFGQDDEDDDDEDDVWANVDAR